MKTHELRKRLKEKVSEDQGKKILCAYPASDWDDRIDLTTTPCWSRTRDDRPDRVVIVDESGKATYGARPDGHLGGVGGE